MSGRALTCSLVFLLLGILIGRHLLETEPSAWGQNHQLAARIGDVNGDSNVNVADAVYLLQHLFVGGPAPVEASAGKKIIFLVRHGEKEVSELSELGRMRAAHLATLFDHMKVDALIATDLVRTQQTLAPLRERQAAMGNPLEMQITDATADATVEAIEALPPGSVAVSAGHTFTVTSAIEKLGATESRLPLPGTEYDNIWVLTLDAGGAEVVPLKYYVLPDCSDCPEAPAGQNGDGG